MADPYITIGCPDNQDYLTVKEQNVGYTPTLETGKAKIVLQNDKAIVVHWSDGSTDNLRLFTALTDVPGSYSGAGGYYLRVKATEDGIEFTPSSATNTDELVKVSATDTTPDFLGNKLVAGTNVTLTVLNSGAAEQIQIDVTGSGTGTDELVKVSGTDTTADYLGAKLQAGSGIVLTVLNSGANETIEVRTDLIDDTQVLSTKTWSSNKISTELGNKSDVGHTHVKADITDFAHTHTKSEITDFAHTHVRADITDFDHGLTDHTDVTITTPSDKQQLIYNATSSVWENGTIINDAGTGTNETWSASKIGLELGNKADKVTGATSGNLAGLDANGNLTDSGSKPSDFASATHSHALGDLSDVDTTGATDGQVLTYDGTNLIWKPVTITAGGDTKQVLVSSTDTTEGYLGSKIVAGSNVTITTLNAGANEQLQISSDQIDDTQILTTKTWSSNKINTELGTKADATHTHTRSDITDFSHPLSEHSDVTITTPSANQQLIYDSVNGAWINGTIIDDASTTTDKTWSASKLGNDLGAKADKVANATAGNFASLDSTGNIQDSGYSSASFAASSHTHTKADITDFAHALGDHSDVSITTPAANQQLLYDSVNSQWVNGTIIDDTSTTATDKTWSASKIQTELNGKSDTTHTHALGDLSDVDTTGAVSGQVLSWNGSLWVPANAGTGTDTKKVLVSSTDTTEDFLGAKLVAGTGISLNTLNAGGNEQIEISATGGGGGGYTLLASVDVTADTTSILLTGLNLVEDKEYLMLFDFIVPAGTTLTTVLLLLVNGDVDQLNYNYSYHVFGDGVHTTYGGSGDNRFAVTGLTKSTTRAKLRIVDGSFVSVSETMYQFNGAFTRVVKYALEYVNQVTSVTQLEVAVDNTSILIGAGSKLRLYEVV